MELLGFLMLMGAAVPVMVLLVEWRRARRPETYFRRVGVVVRREALDAVAEVIGRYSGAEIFGAVVFMGLRYEFDRVAPPLYKEVMRGRELYLEPGLVYVTR